MTKGASVYYCGKRSQIYSDNFSSSSNYSERVNYILTSYHLAEKNKFTSEECPHVQSNIHDLTSTSHGTNQLIKN